MPRLDLRVPFEQKEEAKRLGARWDKMARVWYVPDGADQKPFSAWIPPTPTEVNTRCNRFFIAEGVEPCWKCAENTSLFTFLLPQGHERLQPKGELLEGRWLREEMEVMLYRLTWLGDLALAAMLQHTERFYRDASHGYLATKFFNHCERCGVKQHEPGSAGGHVFQPDDFESAQRITLHYYNRPFEASCHYQDTGIVGFFHDMRKAHIEDDPERDARRYLVE